MGALGLHGITVEEEYGGIGPGLSRARAWRWRRSRGPRRPSGLSYGAHSNLCVNQIRRNGSTEQKQRYLPKLDFRRARRRAGDERSRAPAPTWCRCACAPSGSGDRYVLNGTKMWITNGPDADTLVVYAKTDPAAGARGITAFIIEKGMPGLLAPRRSSTSSACAAPTPANWCSRIARCRQRTCSAQVGRGVDVLMSGLDYERAVLAGGSARHHAGLPGRGACPMCTSASSSASRSATFQLDAGQARRHVHDDECLRAPMSMRWRSACDRGQTTREDAAGAILYAAEKAHVDGAARRSSASAATAISTIIPTGRLLRDAKLYEIGAGTSEIRRMLIGREPFEKSA